ncbi:hypothetical protein R3Q06_35090 [Rhodococcus erythropolis]|nr:hypothetical protein [Rhodococcus erythropolis]MDV6278615.1 hypothetical protein [Rhodococcus erythropolis]
MKDVRRAMTDAELCAEVRRLDGLEVWTRCEIIRRELVQDEIRQRHPKES